MTDIDAIIAEFKNILYAEMESFVVEDTYTKGKNAGIRTVLVLLEDMIKERGFRGTGMTNQELATLREKFVLTNKLFDSAEISALFGEIDRLQAERENKGCGWCNRKDEYDRFECTLINHEGSDMAVNHMIVSCIADYCPVCGRKLEGRG